MGLRQLYFSPWDCGSSFMVSIGVPPGTFFFFLQYPDSYRETEAIMLCERPLKVVAQFEVNQTSGYVYTQCKKYALQLV